VADFLALLALASATGVATAAVSDNTANPMRKLLNRGARMQALPGSLNSVRRYPTPRTKTAEIYVSRRTEATGTVGEWPKRPTTSSADRAGLCALHDAQEALGAAQIA
jgi:hypothetical protein